jgi:outer membrane protein OmpA-like peptidoglycan-associated protein
MGNELDQRANGATANAGGAAAAPAVGKQSLTQGMGATTGTPGPTTTGTPGPAVPQPVGGVGAGGPGTTDPNMCPDPAEQARKEAFRLRTDLHVDNNIPSSGIGKFDAHYFPAAGLMPVTVKIHFDFVQADNTPGFMDRMRRMFRGQSNAMFFWTDAEKTAYVSDYIARVTARWSNQHTIRSIKPCWTEFFAIAAVTPVEHTDKASAHFAITVHKSPGPGIDYKSAINNEHLLDPTKQPTGDMWQSDNREEPDFNSASVATTERQRLEAALTTAAAHPVQFNVDADTAPAARGPLLAFAAAAKQANPSAPMIPINIDGFASAEGDATHNTDLSRRRAEHVAGILRGSGMRQPLRVTPHGPIGTPNDAANRKVDVVVDTAFETTYHANRYSVSEHEFGHMLGNPDEYSNATSGPLGGMQTRYEALVASAGLQATTYGQNTSSQMSAGVDVLPRHYVTLWEALGRMTTPTLVQSDWSLTT